MKKVVWNIIIIAFLIGLPLHAEWVTGKYADAFFDIGVGARPLSMGSAFTAVASDVTSLYWNPAGLAFLPSTQFHVMHSERFSGIVNWDFLGMGMPVSNKNKLAVGIYRLGVDDILLTRLLSESDSLGAIILNEAGERVPNVPYVYGTTSDQQWVGQISIAGNYSKNLAWGGSIRLIRKVSDLSSAWGMGFDLGIQYAFHKNWKWGARLTDATSTILAWEGGRKEVIAPKLTTGTAMNYQIKSFYVTPALDLLFEFDDMDETANFHAGPVSADVMTGLEISYKALVAIRAGLDRGKLTLGTGIRFYKINLDYGFLSHSDLGNTHRISLTLNQLWENNPK